jgi:hypothetical protein
VTGVEGWPIPGRAAQLPHRFDPLPPSVFDDSAAARAATDMFRVVNEAIGLTDISDATVRRVLEGLAKL